jgi:hypothetical protein
MQELINILRAVIEIVRTVPVGPDTHINCIRRFLAEQLHCNQENFFRALNYMGVCLLCTKKNDLARHIITIIQLNLCNWQGIAGGIVIALSRIDVRIWPICSLWIAARFIVTSQAVV